MSKTYGLAGVLLIASLMCASTLAEQAPRPEGGAGRQGTPSQGAGQPAPAPQPASPGTAQQPTFRGGIDFVRVDAFVTDGSGKPVLDLKESDFEVLEDGKAQKIEQFRVIKIDGNEPGGERPHAIRTPDDEQREAQRDDVRVFVLFLDDYHTRDRNALGMRRTLADFVDTQLRPTDMVAVMYPLTGVNDLAFTRDHDQIISAINAFEGRKYDYRPRNDLEANYARYPTDVVERIRNEVVTTALEGLSMRLGGMRDGRKTVIFVSEGFTVLLPPQMRRDNAQFPQLPLVGTTDTRVEAMAEAQGQIDLENRMRDVFKAANRNNTSFYTLDPRGLAVFEFDINDGGAAGVPDQKEDQRMLRSTQDTLRQLAEETDGRAIVNRNTLGAGLAQMVQDSSFYYLIGYTTQAATDSKFHEIKVRVKRSGTTVRARRGYWALSAADVARALSPARPSGPNPAQLALASIATNVQAARWIRTWIGTERGANGKTRVTLTWEPLPVQQGVRREQAGRVEVIAADAKGDLVFRGRSPEGAATDASTVPAGGASSPARAAGAPSSAAQRIAFDAPPGKLDLRLSIAAAAGGTLDMETRTIAVPDLTAPQAALSTPRVFRSRSAREFQLQASDAAAVPVASRDFSRVERLLIRFDVYAAGSEKPVPAAVLLARDGRKIADVPVAPAPLGGTHQIDLSLNALAAGEYVVQVSVADASGATATEMVPLRVGP
jgi:VWFA-related protein